MSSSNQHALSFEEITSTTQLQPSPASTGQPVSLDEYIESHKLTAKAANDTHQLALADFLFERIQRTANAAAEST